MEQTRRKEGLEIRRISALLRLGNIILLMSRTRKFRHHQIDGRFLIRTGLHGVVGF